MIWPLKKKKANSSYWERSDAWPRFVDGKTIMACWTNPERTRRVFLIARLDGMFSEFSEYFSDHECEMCWIEVNAGASFYDSEETALREIHAAYPWSRSVEPARRNAEQGAAADAEDQRP